MPSQTGKRGSYDKKEIEFKSEPLEDSPLYKSDEFRMYCFKVLPCSKRYCHDWVTCPFAHPAEKAKRRDPRVFNYTGVACPEMKKNMQCPRGDTCPYAHNVFEYWLHPSRYRTQLCNDGVQCKRKVCFFAHTLEELRISNVKALDGDLHDPFAPLSPGMEDPFRSATSSVSSSTSPVSPLSPEVWASYRHKQQQQLAMQGMLQQQQQAWNGPCLQAPSSPQALHKPNPTSMADIHLAQAQLHHQQLASNNASQLQHMAQLQPAQQALPSGNADPQLLAQLLSTLLASQQQTSGVSLQHLAQAQAQQQQQQNTNALAQMLLQNPGISLADALGLQALMQQQNQAQAKAQQQQQLCDSLLLQQSLAMSTPQVQMQMLQPSQMPSTFVSQPRRSSGTQPPLGTAQIASAARSRGASAAGQLALMPPQPSLTPEMLAGRMATLHTHGLGISTPPANCAPPAWVPSNLQAAEQALALSISQQALLSPQQQHAMLGAKVAAAASAPRVGGSSSPAFSSSSSFMSDAGGIMTNVTAMMTNGGTMLPNGGSMLSHCGGGGSARMMANGNGANYTSSSHAMADLLAPDWAATDSSGDDHMSHFEMSISGMPLSELVRM